MEDELVEIQTTKILTGFCKEDKWISREANFFVNLSDIKVYFFKTETIQKQPARCVLMKNYSENMQKIYRRRTPMSKCYFNKVAFQLYWNRTSTWVFSCKFAAYFQNTFPKNISEGLLLTILSKNFLRKKPAISLVSNYFCHLGDVLTK